MAWKAFNDPRRRGPGTCAGEYSLYLMWVGPLFSIFVYIVEPAYLNVSWGPTEQTAGTCTHLDKESACLTQPNKGGALYDDLPQGKHGPKNPLDSNKAEQSLPRGGGSPQTERERGGSTGRNVTFVRTGHTVEDMNILPQATGQLLVQPRSSPGWAVRCSPGDPSLLTSSSYVLSWKLVPFKSHSLIRTPPSRTSGISVFFYYISRLRLPTCYPAHRTNLHGNIFPIMLLICMNLNLQLIL